MLHSRILEHLVELKLSGMLSAFEEMATLPAGQKLPEQMLLELLQAESAECH